MPDIPTAAIASAVKQASKVRPWANVKRHNRLVHETYEDLLTFARDLLKAEAAALIAVKEEVNKRNLLFSGFYGSEQNRIRDEHAVKWRDFKRKADRRLAELREAEGVEVRLWRKLTKTPWPENPDAGELRSLARAWEDESVRRAAVANEMKALGM